MAAMNKPIPSTIKSRLRRYALQAFSVRARFTATMQAADQKLDDIHRLEIGLSPLVRRVEYLRVGAERRIPEFTAEHAAETARLRELQADIAAKRAEAQAMREEASGYAQQASQIGAVVNGIVRELGVTRRELGIDFNDSPMPQPSTVIPVSNYRTGAA